VPGLIHARRAENRRLPEICQQITKRGRANTLRATILSGLRSPRLRSLRAVGNRSLLPLSIDES
jgi:hypothetical protein